MSNRKNAIVRGEFVSRFPLAFMPKGAPKIPLKIGIREDIFARCPDLDRVAVHLALADYTGGPTYQRNVVVGRSRVDLDGNYTSPITEDEAIHALVRLNKLYLRWRERDRALAAA
jgi:ProP effector